MSTNEAFLVRGYFERIEAALDGAAEPDTAVASLLEDAERELTPGAYEVLCEALA